MQPLKVTVVPVTAFQQNCSIVACTATNRAAIVDPGGDVVNIRAAIDQLKVTPEKIWLTHGHIDHAGGAGLVFALDSATFLFSATMLLLIRAPAAPAQPGSASVVRDLAEGWRFVRGRVWLWATFASAAVAYLCFMGPVEVLLPYLVKNDLDGNARDLGMVFAAGGLGSVACALAMGQRDIPRRGISFIYATWTLATLAVAGY